MCGTKMCVRIGLKTKKGTSKWYKIINARTPNWRWQAEDYGRWWWSRRPRKNGPRTSKHAPERSDKNECEQSMADRANMEDGKYYNDRYRWVNTENILTSLLHRENLHFCFMVALMFIVVCICFLPSFRCMLSVLFCFFIIPVASLVRLLHFGRIFRRVSFVPFAGFVVCALLLRAHKCGQPAVQCTSYIELFVRIKMFLSLFILLLRVA